MSKQADPKLRAALAFELAALTEVRLADRPGALSAYREARSYHPSFRPVLFALQRLLRAARDFDELARVLAELANASTHAPDRAAALVDLGCLFEDQLEEPGGAANSFERALAADPSCLAASLMLERSLRALGRGAEADAVVTARAPHSFDPELRSVLARETARVQAAHGPIGPAIETLLAAVAVRGRRFSTLLALAELATEHRLPATAARAFEDAATLLASHASGQPGPDAEDIASRLATPDAAMPFAAWLYRRAGAQYLSCEEQSSDAQRTFERACASHPEELVLYLELAEACEASGALGSARTSLHALLDRAPPRRAAALHFRLAELAQHAGDAEEARSRLRAGLLQDPDSPVLRAAYEDALIDAGGLDDLATELEQRAERSQAEDARIAWLRAAAAADALGEGARALSLYRRCAERFPQDSVVLRELYGAALRCRDHAAIADAAGRLLACSLPAPERSALWRDRYDAWFAAGEHARALEVLRGALEDPACESWAGHTAWGMASTRGDFVLLASAHRALSEQAPDRDQAAAHLAAAGRAWLRLDGVEQALECFRRVLELSPTDPYAVAALEALLIERNETGAALQLLREAAAAEQSQQRSELALLHAGAAAELAGRAELAARSYEDALDADPESLAAAWARLRLAERTHDVALGTRSRRALAARELGEQQPGIGQLELAERLDVLGEWDEGQRALAWAFQSEQVGHAAAVSALLAARVPEQDSGPRQLRVQALGRLAQTASGPLRAAIEHEQIAELLYDAPADARTLLIARTEHAPLGLGDELLAFLLSEDATTRSRTLANLARLDPEPAARAELSLHAIRTQVLHELTHDDEALVSALARLEEAPESLAAAVALDEALTEPDAAELRVTALLSRLRHTPAARSGSLQSELLQAYLDADRMQEAIALARTLLDRDPSDLCAWDALREGARRAGDHAQLVAACDELANHVGGRHRAALLEEAALTLHERLQDPAAAEVRLRAALSADPTSASAFERLHDLLLEQGDLIGLGELLRERIAHCESSDEKLDLQYTRARILRGLGQRGAALDCLREVLAVEPLHAAALGLAAEIHASEQSWGAAVAALEALARCDVAPAQRRLAREGAADFLEHKLKNPAAAYAQLAALADSGDADVAVFTRMADVSLRANLSEHAARALSQAAAHSSGSTRAGFERRAAAVYARNLGRSADARDALRRALAADPLDIEALEALHASADPRDPELTSSEMFLHELWAALRSDPADPKLLRSLGRCAQLRADTTLEYLALSTLAALGLATSEEQIAFEAERAKSAVLPVGVLTDMQFSLLGGPMHTQAAFRVARLVCRAGLPLVQSKPETGRRTRVREGDALWHGVAALVRTFGLGLGELHRGEGKPRDVLIWPKGNGQIACWVRAGVALPESAPARFSLGAQCAALRLGVLPLVQAERGAARDLLNAALCLAPNAPQPTDAARLRPLATALGRELTRKERRELEAWFAALPEPGQGLHEVSEDARAGAFRAGLLVARDIAPALHHVFGDEYTLGTIVNSKLGLRLLRFWTSQTCLALLRGIGTST